MDDSLIELAQGKFGRVVAFRLKPGADLYLGMEEACRKYGISNGVIVSALGSVNGALFCDADVLPGTYFGYGYSDPIKVDEVLELTAVSGIICHDAEGNINLHVHVNFSDKNGTVYGGHLIEGTKVLITVDGIIAEVEGIDMGRKLHEPSGLMLFSPGQL